MIEQNKIYNMDCLDGLAQMQPESVDLICTDSPYGLSFMGKNWDKATPSTEIWRECYRILKAGAFAFVMSSPRSDVLCQMVTRLTEAGFRTDFTPIYWAYASGFPKAMNVGKMVDKKFGLQRNVIGTTEPFGRENRKGKSGSKFGDNFNGQVEYNITEPACDKSKKLDGAFNGFQPKPALEVIIVAMKPLSENTFVDQALKNGKGITWLDDCRVPFQNEADKGDPDRFKGVPMLPPEKGFNQNKVIIDVEVGYKGGRFPANLLVSDNCLDNGEKHVARKGVGSQGKDNQMGFRGTNPSVDYVNNECENFSRYFSLDAWWQQQITKLPLQVQQTFPFLIVPKASNSERNDNLENLPKTSTSHIASPTGGGGGWKDDAAKNPNLPRQNIHPTVKPISLFCYLVTLGSRPNDLVVDPFVGSGTTAIACKILNRNYIAFEKEAAYHKIAVERTNFSVNQPLADAIVTNSQKYLTPDNIEKAIIPVTKINKKFGAYFK